MFLPRYLADTSALLNLVGTSGSPLRPRDLTLLLSQGRLKIPEAVAREIRKKDDRLKAWVDRHKPRCVLRATNENIAELSRISRDYKQYLGDKVGAGDPIVICMATYYSGSWFLALTDDGGIQAVCVLEKIPYVTSSAFCRLEGL